jgi:hypothetical protein
MNDLVPANVTGGELVNFDDITSSSVAYLRRLQLFTNKSDACAEGRIGIGHWGIVDDSAILDMGTEVDLVILAYRAKALQIDGDAVVTDYDAKSETFAAIREKSFVRDSGCMFGPEFLVYIPSVDFFATYFASSKTSRREAKKMAPLIGDAATFKSHLIEKGRWKWHGPLVFPCSVPLEIPDVDIISVAIEKFKNPPKNEVEVADDDNDGRER